MNRSAFRFLVLFATLAASALSAFSQVSSTSSLSGAVVDPSGAVVAGVSIGVKNEATGEEFRATTAGNGTFTVPALAAGIYTATVAAPGFKQAVIRGIKLDAGIPATVNVSLEIGTATDTVVVQSTGEVLQTQSANISTTITGRQITDLPFTSRNATDLLLFLPGTTTPGRPRSSSFNGLPQGAINMTLDGLNIQDNAIKNGDGFYTNFYPRTDAVEEVTLSTATPGAESAGEGAIQIKMVTRQGSNEYHGSIYEYHRNPVLNANYWYNNRDQLPGPNDDPATFQAPRDRLLLNQFGGRFGGPIVIPKVFDGRDRAFFFVNYEQFRLATQVSQTRNILHPLSQQGIFQWKATQGGQTVIQQRNLLDLARAAGRTSAIDPTMAKLLADIRSATQTRGSVEVVTDPNRIVDPNVQRYTYSPTGGGEIRIFPTVRLDFNLSSRHHLEEIFLPQTHHTLIDYLNNGAPAFPGFPSFGSQQSTRFGNTIALRSTLTNTLVNEARFAFSGGTVAFNGEGSAANYTGSVANQAGFNLNINAAAGINNATISTNIQRRNAPIKQFSDTMSWTRGAHSLSFGTNFTQVNYFQSVQTFAPQINFGVDTTDPASSLFAAANFPGASTTDINNARALYAVLVGSVTGINANALLDEETNKYTYNGLQVRRAQMREIGLFAQDTWRVKQNLTLNYGLRWEVQLSVIPRNDNLSITTVDDLYGISGPGNLFKPNATGGRPTQFTQFKEGDKAFNTDYGNFAPSLGFAWTPSWKTGWLGKVFGTGGESVIRGGFSIAYNREGIGDILGTLTGNPGGTLSANRSVANSNLGALPLLLSQTSRLGPPVTPDSPVYPLTNLPGGYAITDAAGIYDPNYKLPYVMSWSFGLQREITRDMVIEVRYVANRGLRTRTTFNLNEINIVENGFLNEFKLAQANLIANSAAGGARAGSFAYFGPGTGTTPLPTILGYFSGSTAATGGPTDPRSYASTLFRNATFVNPLVVNNAAPFTFAQSLYNNAGQRNNALAAGLPANFFLTNPALQGGSSFTGNGGHTYYDSAVVELRRRMSKGLLVQGSYVFARGFSLTGTSLRAPYFKTLSPLVVNHAFKADWIYDLPFGRGQRLLSNAGGVLGKALEGWSFQGGARLQSGAPVVFNGAQTNAPGGLTGLQLVGMSLKDLQKSIKMRFDDAARIAYFLPQDIIDNTIRAFSVSATSATGYGSLGAPTGRYIAPANRAGCIETYAGQCGFPNLVLYGPRFSRFDMSLIKRTKITERVNFEFRAEFLNAFNDINFSIQNPSNATTTVGGTAGGPPAGVANSGFGRVGFAYRDISTTNDPGGRIIQFVGRINF
ncbi:MAG: Plug and carboxypeptidase regulatory-like domain-containing protein [Acidobacteria bacterium]|nr:Plug and carboxypeptidase regulatory-like domain-containing protein [Acidobacteriota bacterium]